MREKVWFRPPQDGRGNEFWLRNITLMQYPDNPFPPIGASAIWDQHCRFLSPSRDDRIDGKSETLIVRIVSHDGEVINHYLKESYHIISV